MELLGNSGNVLKDGKFEIKLKVITKPMQTAYIDVASNKDDRSNFLVHVNLIDYVLTNCVEMLKIDGKEYDPLVIAETANIMDEDTMEELRIIHEMCSSSLEGLGEADKKK